MPKSGLLSRAIDIHEKASGISVEDRREILARIDELTKKNRMGGKKSAFVARSRGILFPVVVNLAAAALTAGGLWGLSVAFREKEAAVSEAGAALSSAEGKLIRELKRDSESKLGEKDKEIADMQARIAALDADRTKLQSTFENRVASKEAELRDQMKAELEKERQRLAAEGLSETLIQERLKRFEEERNAAFRRELAAFQNRIDAERAAADANYAKLRDEYRSGMANLNDERRRIQDESRRREDELRSSMETKTKALQQETALAAEEREKARAELSRAEEARKARDAAEERVVGLYVSVRNALQERRFDEAASRAAALRTYINEQGLGTAAAQGRRQADLFAAEAFSFMARTELERASLDNSLLLRQAELVSAVRGAAVSARAAIRSGDAAAGEKAYQDALRTIPEILEAHDYFTARERNAEAARRQKAAGQTAAAAAALDRGEYETAAAAYREAAAQLTLDEAAARALSEGLARLSIADYNRGKANSDSRAAQQPLARAFVDLGASRWSAAITGFASILATYPSARQVPEALRGIEDAFAGLAKAAEARAEEDRARIRALETNALRLSAELAETRAAGEAELARTAAENEAKLLELQRLLETARAETSIAAANAAAAARAAEEEKARTARESERAEGDPAEQLAKLREENAKLAAAAARYDSLVSSYASYRSAEDAARNRGGSGSLVEARSRFDAFLDDAETRRSFPDLRDRISRYEKEFAAAGQTESIHNAIDAAENALALKDAQARDRFLDDLAKRYGGNEDMKAYIETLRRGLR